MASGFKRSGKTKNWHLLVGVACVLPLAACNTGPSALSLSPSETITQGYVIDEDTLSLVPEGSSREQVLLALGTPTTINEYSGQEVFYYISQTRRRGAQFMKPRLVDQRVLAVYFDQEQTVNRIANYGVQDGVVFDFITRTTPTGGVDQTFLAQILSGTLAGGVPGVITGR